MNKKGFSFIEIIIAIAILSILVGIAIPSYLHHIRRTNRTNAISAIQLLQMEEEKYRYNHTEYTTALTIPADIAEHYTLAIPSADANGYTITATATGSQASDSVGVESCATLTLIVLNGVITKSPAACWND